MCGRFDNLIARDAYRGLFRVGRLANSNVSSPLQRLCSAKLKSAVTAGFCLSQLLGCARTCGAQGER